MRQRRSAAIIRSAVILILAFVPAAAAEAQTTYEGVLQYLELLPASATDGSDQGTVVEVRRPATATSPYALILIPGGGLSSLLYRPDGGPERGWASRFTAAGFPVYLTHPPARRDGPVRWNATMVWPLWGIGESYPATYEDSRFDVAKLEDFHAVLAVDRQPMSASQLSALLDRTGPAYVLSHSAGGRLMFAAEVLSHRNLKGTIAVETLRCPEDPDVLMEVYVRAERRFLSIWGDRLERGRPSMSERYESCRGAALTIALAGGEAQTIHLPEDAGIRGNSHLLMLDENSDQLADLLLDWIRQDRTLAED